MGQCNSIAVVGSSFILVGKHYGRMIDSHDCVFRTNHAPTQGFEKDVGRRTTIRTVGPAILHMLLNDYKKNGNFLSCKNCETFQYDKFFAEHHFCKQELCVFMNKMTAHSVRDTKLLNSLRHIAFIPDIAMKSIFKWQNCLGEKTTAISGGMATIILARTLTWNVSAYGFESGRGCCKNQNQPYRYYGTTKSHQCCSKELETKKEVIAFSRLQKMGITFFASNLEAYNSTKETGKCHISTIGRLEL